MISDETYSRAGIPISLLGLHWRSWRKADISMILSHYGVGSEARTLKLILMRRLNRLCRHRGLDRYDRLEFFRAYRNGVPLPPCKPRILRSRRDTKPIRGARTTQSTRSKHHNRRADTNVRGLYFRPAIVSILQQSPLRLKLLLLAPIKLLFSTVLCVLRDLNLLPSLSATLQELATTIQLSALHACPLRSQRNVKIECGITSTVQAAVSV